MGLGCPKIYHEAEDTLVSDNSVWGLLLANLVTIMMAVMQDWSLLLVMWVYWCQSVIIGLFNFWRMMTLADLIAHAAEHALRRKQVAEPLQGAS